MWVINQFPIGVNGWIAETMTIKIVVWIVLFQQNLAEIIHIKEECKNMCIKHGHNYVGNRPISYWNERVDSSVHERTTAMDNDIPLIDSSALYQRRQRGPSDATTMMTMDTPIK